MEMKQTTQFNHFHTWMKVKSQMTQIWHMTCSISFDFSFKNKSFLVFESNIIRSENSEKLKELISLMMCEH